MPKTGPGEAVPNVAELARKSWYAFKHFNAGSSTDPRISYVVGYQSGWRHCLSRTAEFSGLMQQIAHLNALLEDAAVMQDAVELVGDEVVG
jgi:hypothetical protein